MKVQALVASTLCIYVTMYRARSGVHGMPSYLYICFSQQQHVSAIPLGCSPFALAVLSCFQPRPSRRMRCFTSRHTLRRFGSTSDVSSFLCPCSGHTASQTAHIPSLCLPYGQQLSMFHCYAPSRALAGMTSTFVSMLQDLSSTLPRPCRRAGRFTISA